MIQKKICMVGMFATGKTSLVRRFVHTMFSEKYHSTVGVKIDRKSVDVDGTSVNLVLWDLAGRDGVEDIQSSYLRGASGVLYVVDGTRRETFEELFDMRELCRKAVGEVPSVVALNKSDLEDEWVLTDQDLVRLTAEGLEHFITSAKSGDGVESAFTGLAAATLGE